MVSEGSGSPQYPPGPARYQALWWNTEGITFILLPRRRRFPGTENSLKPYQELSKYMSFPVRRNDSQDLGSQNDSQELLRQPT